MPITLVNRDSAELTIYIGKKGDEKLILQPGERLDDIDGAKCLDIKENIFVKGGLIEVFGDPSADVKKTRSTQTQTQSTGTPDKSSQKAEATK